MSPDESCLVRPMGGSFRDPHGALYSCRERTIRIVSSEGTADLAAFLNAGTALSFVQTGRLVRTRILDDTEAAEFLAGIEAKDVSLLPRSIVEHETIPFQSFPYEWPFEMLRAAAQLTLDLAEATLREGMGLKDATPYNILFRGPTAVFVDILSFEKRSATDPIWLACGQFERTFLIPLLLCSELDLPLEMLLLAKRDGLYPRDAYGAFKRTARFKPSVLSSITLPALLERSRLSHDLGAKAKSRAFPAEKTKFILGSLFRRLRRAVMRIPVPRGRASRWTHYMSNRESYRDEQFTQKKKFVENALIEFKPEKVLDVGCNTGYFSTMAAQRGASVVAIDSDTRVVGKLWEDATSKNLDVLPLVVSIAQPTPAIGWRNGETPSFLERAKGRFDAVLFLAVIHHLLVTDRIPLHEILDLIAELTSSIAIVEFVSPKDPMFREMASVNQSLYIYLTNEGFERACATRFDIVRSCRLQSGERWLYLLKKRPA